MGDTLALIEAAGRKSVDVTIAALALRLKAEAGSHYCALLAAEEAGPVAQAGLEDCRQRHPWQAPDSRESSGSGRRWG